MTMSEDAENGVLDFFKGDKQTDRAGETKITQSIHGTGICTYINYNYNKLNNMDPTGYVSQLSTGWCKKKEKRLLLMNKILHKLIW